MQAMQPSAVPLDEIWLSSAGHGRVPCGPDDDGGSHDTAGSSAGVRLLIIDDDVSFLDAAKRALTSGGLGFAVTTAETGAQALEMLRRDPTPDLILLDYHLPDVTAPHFLQLLAGTDVGGRPPVLVVTREARDNARDESLCAGATDFAPKPSRVRALRELVLLFWERHGTVADDSAD